MAWSPMRNPEDALQDWWREMEDERLGLHEDDLRNVMRAEAQDFGGDYSDYDYLISSNPFYFDPFEGDPLAIPF